MKKQLLAKMFSILFVAVCCLGSKAQTEQENLKKYWNYRDKFQKQFVRIGSAQGNSIIPFTGDCFSLIAMTNHSVIAKPLLRKAEAIFKQCLA